MSRLVLDLRVPAKYDRQAMTDIVRAICGQVNQLSEGNISARYTARSVVPSASLAAAVGDMVWDSNTTVRASVAPGVASSYVRTGWVCTVGGTGTGGDAPTWQEMRALTGA